MARILVVEDESHLAYGIKYNLEAEGYEVEVAGEGPEALRLVREDPEAFDLIILDLMLPGMSGYAVCEDLRESGQQIPVLILSARTLAEDRARGFDAGADQYLMKPFDLDELLSRVRNLLARWSPARSAAETVAVPAGECRFGRAVVNFETFEASVEDRPLQLTALEMKLLRYFVENEGRVVSREELLEKVWGYAAETSSRTVDNFVSRLRKYFERDAGSPHHFLSVRGAGYRFVSERPSGT